jgi:ABC-2 type transport system permease protein
VSGSGVRPVGRGAMIRLVARRELRERTRAKSFLVGTGLLVLVILAIGVVNRVVADDGPGRLDVGVVAEQSDRLEDAVDCVGLLLGRDAAVTFVVDPHAARAALGAGDIDVAVDPSAMEVVFDDDVDATVAAAVQDVWSVIVVEDRLTDAGLGPDEIAEVLDVAAYSVVTVDQDDGPSGIALLTGTLSAILLFISLQTFGTYVLTGVVEEKSSAVVELLLVRASADELLAGKVIGIGVAALAQFTAAILAGLVSLAMSGVDVPSEIWSALPMMLVWFLGGFALYSTLFALAGSLVSRQEDAQSAAAPIGYGLVAAYMLVFVLGADPESTASTVLSLVPPVTPLLMPMRTAAGAASVVEVLLGMVGLLVATIAAWKLAARIYHQVLLHRGARIAWKDALRLLRTE